MPDLQKNLGEVLPMLKSVGNLMKANGENPFKVRAFQKARDLLKKVDEAEFANRVQSGTLTELKGVGKGISETITEFCFTGESSVEKELAAALPPGLLELMKISGLGASKAKTIVNQLGVQSLAELEYACRENRLSRLKGFGEKEQDRILEELEFLNSHQGEIRLDTAVKLSSEILLEIKKIIGKEEVVEIGELGRKSDTVSILQYLVCCPQATRKKIEPRLERWRGSFRRAHPQSIEVEFYFTTESRFGYERVKRTSHVSHWESLGSPRPFSASTELEFYKKQKLPEISPEMRESAESVDLARRKKLGSVISRGDMSGIFHNHTTYSDGAHSVEEMATEAKKLGFQYIGISDHSQSAIYANGLKGTRLASQKKEIAVAQKKMKDFRIFWGIESDILKDGSLDYPERTLKGFDFVIASVHQRFKLNRKQMTDRIVRAIENPFTVMIGHLTGRLLLGRKGYDLDIEKILKAAKVNEVAIELNSNPERLDIDWRWGEGIRKSGVLIAINPDAHRKESLSDTDYGVLMARKALIPKKQILNIKTASEIESWLKERRK